VRGVQPLAACAELLAQPRGLLDPGGTVDGEDRGLGVDAAQVLRHLVRVVATTHDGERGGGDRRLLGWCHVDHGTSAVPPEAPFGG
jgi:hypothetical protein